MEEKTYKEKFLLYLDSLHRFKDEEAAALVNFAEVHLPELLRSNDLPTDGNIYDNLSTDFWEQVLTGSLVDSNSTQEQRDYAARMMEALKFFRGFIRFNKTADYKKLFADKLKRERAKLTDNSRPEEEGTSRPEGAVSQVCVTHYERNPEDRLKALKKYGYHCQVCGMDFEAVYGEIGRQFIEVHHLYPVCNMGEHYVFDPLDEEKGLVPLCSNCHSMIHRGGTVEIRDGKRVIIPMTLAALREVYNRHKNKAHE